MTERLEGPPAQVTVVGIGASAGGVEALKEFFRVVAPDLGLAYVVVVHLAPDRPSEMAAILGHSTEMPVAQVGDHDRVPLEPDHVYVIAPDRKLEVVDGSIGAARFDEPRGRHAAIDVFFRSLAAQHADGFAIILSGSGSDGALGAKAVKESGGLVLVQSPSEAAHPQMPNAVINAGLADRVLPVAELAAAMSTLAFNKRRITASFDEKSSASRSTESHRRAIELILEAVRNRTGHDFSRYKRTTILRRLVRRMQLCGEPGPDEYLRYLQSTPAEIDELLADFLISVTQFFRDSSAWDALRDEVIGALVRKADPTNAIRVWVPGCASGEEAYGLAILISEEIERSELHRDFTIFASDVDEAALTVARHGRYPAAIVADVSDERLRRYFHPEDTHFRVDKALRNHVVFASHSLLRDPPFVRIDLVSCRNLLIYLDRPLQEQVISVFHYACHPGGYLFLGIAETADPRLFRPIDKKFRLFERRPSANDSRMFLPQLLPLPKIGADVSGTAVASPPPPKHVEVHAQALESHAPPSLLVDARGQILHLSASAWRFLQHQAGEPTRKLMELVRAELHDGLFAALFDAFEQGGRHLSPFASIKIDGVARRVATIVTRHSGSDGSARNALVVFLEVDDHEVAERESAPESDQEQLLRLQQRLAQADQRIDQMRDEHHVVNEDLRAANEELQSLNEEYRSTTEELETSKEELQSINEELHTVNHELKVKIEEITRANSDLENLMAATDVATLFLDPDLRVKRFTPQFAELFNVKSTDLGRQISDFTHNIEYESLEADARKVLADSQPIERETRSGDGRSFLIRLRPYRSGSGRNDGVVVTMLNVTALKDAELHLLEKTRDLLEQDRNKEMFLAMLGHELRNPLASISNSLQSLALAPDRDDRVVGVLHRQSRHMSRLIDDLLDISRINRGTLALQCEVIELQECIEHSLETVDRQQASKAIRYELDLPSDPIYVNADRDRLGQVMDNLLRNATAHTPSEGVINISARNDGPRVTIRIRDNGCGIDAGRLATLFEPFSQSETSARGGGLGLGLALVKQLVELHGGVVSAASEGPGKGSEFSVTIDTVDAPAEAIPRSRACDLDGHRILIVDDDQDVADTMAALLQSLGQEVAIAYSGIDALEMASTFKPRMAIVDLKMPEMDGFEVAMRLRERYSRAQLMIVSLSGNFRRADDPVPHAGDGGRSATAFDRSLLKPVAMEALCELLKAPGAEETTGNPR